MIRTRSDLQMSELFSIMQHSTNVLTEKTNRLQRIWGEYVSGPFDPSTSQELRRQYKLHCDCLKELLPPASSFASHASGTLDMYYLANGDDNESQEQQSLSQVELKMLHVELSAAIRGAKEQLEVPLPARRWPWRIRMAMGFLSWGLALPFCIFMGIATLTLIKTEYYLLAPLFGILGLASLAVPTLVASSLEAEITGSSR